MAMSQSPSLEARVPTVEAKSSFLGAARAKMARGLKVLGLGALLTVGYDAGNTAVHEAASVSLEAEKRPEVLKKVHDRLNAKYQSDKIAAYVANLPDNQKEVLDDLERHFDESIADDDELKFDGVNPYHVALASSSYDGATFQYVVAGRGSNVTSNTYLLGLHKTAKGEEINPEEARALALADASQNFSDAQADVLAMADTPEAPERTLLAMNRRTALRNMIQGEPAPEPEKEKQDLGEPFYAIVRNDDQVAMR